jgi:MFS family permease
VLAAVLLGWLFDGFEIGLGPLLARPALRDLLAGRGGEAAVGEWMGIITALFLLGAASGGLLFGWLGDRIGRVRALGLSILTYSLFTGAGYLAAAPWQLGALRAVAALGMGGEWAVGMALLAEHWPEAGRPALASATGAAGNLGYLLVALLGALVPVTPSSWRWLMLVAALPALLVVPVRLFVPESERWQRAVRAAGTVRPLRELLAPALRGRTLLGVGLASVALVGTWGSVQWIPLWVDQMTGGRAPQAKAVAQMLVGLGAVAGSAIAPLAAGRFGRRATFCGLAAASLLATTVLFRLLPARYDAAFLVATFVVGATTASFYGWFGLYFPELFPTRVRATGQGVCYNAGRVLAAFGSLAQGRLVALFDGSYARGGATITLVYLIGMAIVWLGPETRGRALPE